VAPKMDLHVMERNREYIDRPENREFAFNYLRAIYAAFLQAGDRTGASRVLAILRRRGGLDGRVVRLYVRHAPEFRKFKTILRYNDLRRLAYSLKGRGG
jgi:hypothetical protein